MATPAQYRNPYGDSFIVNTPALDRYSQQLYQEQRQRQANQQKQADLLDKQFQDEVTKIRSADVPDHYDNYNAYKKSKQELAAMNPTKDPKAFMEKQLESQKLLAKTFTHAQESIQQKQIEDESTKVLLDPSKRDLFADDAYDRVMQARRIPVSQKDKLPNMDLSYKGDNYDASKDMEDARGKAPIQRKSIENKVPGDDLSTDIIPVSTYNDPKTYQNILLAKSSTHKGERFYSHLWDKLPDEEKARVDKQFQDMQATGKWEKLIGSNAPIDLDPRIPDSKAENAISYLSKLYYINENPEFGKINRQKNEQLSQQRQFGQQVNLESMRENHQEHMAKIQDDYAKGRIDYKAAVNAGGGEGVLNNYVNSQKEDATQSPINHNAKGEPVSFTIGVGGADYKGKYIKMPKDITDKYTIDKGAKVEWKPDSWLMTNDDKYVIPVQFEKDKHGTVKLNENGKPILKSKGDAVLMQTYKQDLGKVWLTKKESAQENAGDFEDDGLDGVGSNGGVVPAAHQSKKPAKKGKYD